MLGQSIGTFSGGTRRDFEGGNVAVYENVGGIAADVIRRLNGGEAAVTIGHAILYTKALDISDRKDQWLYAHEREHVKQSDIMGILYLPAYAVGFLLARLDHDSQFMEALANGVASQKVPGVR